jgi:predicted enzyme related to lactoylglutathione lyase
MEQDKTIGAVTWMDLTVPDADQVRDFYAAVTGWAPSAVPMGGYDDYCMASPADNAVRSGICHAQGANAGIPPAWIIYINVADLDKSMAEVAARGGEVVHGPRTMGPAARYCIIRDPSGAHCGLFDHGDRL